ncbi:MAG: ABC transporter permease [Candidatus Promineifilaceae bacterium]|nr:ABC transporter permease [Candidatus Promineifilaceae bacterium]
MRDKISRFVDKMWRFFIRTSSFVRKELFGSLRQPRLMLTLVLGPFLILLLFGLGYRVEPQSLRTLFVLSEDSPFQGRLEEYSEDISPQLEMVGIRESLAQGLGELRRGNVDLVVVLPEHPVESIRNSERAVFTLYHNEIDPYQVDYIDAFARIYVDELNRRVLADVAGSGQEESASAEEALVQTQTAAANLRQALEAGNRGQAIEHRNELERGLNALLLAVGSGSQLVSDLEERFGLEESQEAEIRERLARMRQLFQSLQSLTATAAGSEIGEDEAEVARQIEEEAGAMEKTIDEFQTIAPGVLVSPFRAEIESVSPGSLRVSDFYVPSALALLAQHLAVTFGALSIVRDRQRGTMELFQVSPLGPLEGLLGKYVSYFLLEGLLLAILTALSLWVLRVPVLGSWGAYFLALSTLIFTGLGLGFVLSLLARNTSQAVQYSMIVLLASIFFSGLFLSLQLLRPAVQVVSWTLPATYGTQMLQDVMLRGAFSNEDASLLAALLGMGVAFFLAAWYLLRREMGLRRIGDDGAERPLPEQQ